MNYSVLFVFILVTMLMIALMIAIKIKNMDAWIASYMLQRIRARSARKANLLNMRHIMFCFVDHYEPKWKSPSLDVERARVDRWLREYPILCERHRDADGRFPQHTFFYPEEEYREEHLDNLAKLCSNGYGEIEIHLHHDNDTSDNLRLLLTKFKKVLHERHGALSIDRGTGEVVYGFIHGNWCLDNSRRDGRRCGVNDELIVLKETGCYADFTLPSAPDETQTSAINEIYYAKDNPHAPKSHNRGRRVAVGKEPWGDLMIIQGPLALNWRRRKLGLFPRIENGDIKNASPPTTERIDRWVEQAIHVAGRPEWIFIKVHTHGTQERDMNTLLGKDTGEMFEYLETQYNDGKNWALHYVSAREMYNIVKAAEAGKVGDPNEYRDFVLDPPLSYMR